MERHDEESILKSVRERYGNIAKDGHPALNAAFPMSCCGKSSKPLNELSKQMGYSEEQLSFVPDGANMGLSCGNPGEIAGVRTGETVLDLGSGGGFDCFQMAARVGEAGRVIGVDMTPEMVSKARENLSKGHFPNVEFRLGEIEHLPVADSAVDVILSNCVVNLSPDKPQAFREAFRVLKPGGRLSIADIVATSPMPEDLRNDMALLTGCVAGAATVEALEGMLGEAGFEGIRIVLKDESRELIRQWAPGLDVHKYIVSATIQAAKPIDGTLQDPADRATPKTSDAKLKGNGTLDSKAIKKQVYKNLESGLHCAEALSKAVLDAVSGKPHRDVVKASSGFGGGIAGTTEELCGGFTGGVLALGALLGRDKGLEDLKDCGLLIKELRKRFLKEFGSVNCGAILKGFDEAQKPFMCAKITAKGAEMVVDLLNQYEKDHAQALSTLCCKPRGKVALGACPFGANC
jgi:arsenite methyltransferase